MINVKNLLLIFTLSLILSALSKFVLPGDVCLTIGGAIGNEFCSKEMGWPIKYLVEPGSRFNILFFSVNVAIYFVALLIIFTIFRLVRLRLLKR